MEGNPTRIRTKSKIRNVRRSRLGRMPKSDIMTVPVCYHFGTRTSGTTISTVSRGHEGLFPECHFIQPFVELTPRLFLLKMLLMQLYAFGKVCFYLSHRATEL